MHCGRLVPFVLFPKGNALDNKGGGGYTLTGGIVRSWKRKELQGMLESLSCPIVPALVAYCTNAE